MTIALLPAALRLAEQRDAKIPGGLEFGLRSVTASLHSWHGFRWPFPGRWATASGPFTISDDPCPSAPGDGLCVARSWRGMGSCGLPANHVLLVGYRPSDVLGDDGRNKLRAKRVRVIELFSPAELIAERGMDESFDLDGANLDRANLRGASLDRASLDRASLDGANLDGANLDRASLDRASLRGANLRGANLYGASLCGANLRGANLYGANLRGANLDRANLRGANLDGANLYGTLNIPEGVRT